MHRSLPFAALVLAPFAVTLGGCHHASRRDAYEIHYQPGTVAYRAPTPRRAAPIYYSHGHSRHLCDARCEGYWPDVYEHGAAGHRCDEACGEYRAPRAERVVAPGYYHEVRVYPHGHAAHACEPRCGGYRTRSVGLSVGSVGVELTTTTYHHGHVRHRCSTSCGSYSWPHGHARHACTTSCGSYSYARPHGYAGHACSTSCDSYSYARPHGYAGHACSTSCGSYSWPHGHARHACFDGCHGWRHHAAPIEVVIHPHGHRLHVCGQGCGSRSSSWRAAVGIDTHGHRCLPGCGCGRYSAPRWTPSHHRAPHVYAPRHAPRVFAPHHRAPRVFAPHRSHRSHHGSGLGGALHLGLHLGGLFR